MNVKKSSSKSVEDLRAMIDVLKLNKYVKYNEIIYNINQRVMWRICVNAYSNSCQMLDRKDLKWKELT